MRSKYLIDHELLRESLTAKYGAPDVASNDYWISDGLYRDTPDEWGMAVATGSLSRISSWSLDGTEIELSTSGEKFQVSNRIRYASSAHKDEIAAMNTLKDSDGL